MVHYDSGDMNEQPFWVWEGEVGDGSNQIFPSESRSNIIRLFDLPSRQQLSSTMKELYIEYKYK